MYILYFTMQISYIVYISSSSLLLPVISTNGLIPKIYRAAPRLESHDVEIANMITADNFQPLVQLCLKRLELCRFRFGDDINVLLLHFDVDIQHLDMHHSCDTFGGFGDEISYNASPWMFSCRPVTSRISLARHMTPSPTINSFHIFVLLTVAI